MCQHTIVTHLLAIDVSEGDTSAAQNITGFRDNF